MRSPRFSRISAFRPSQTTIQSPVPIFILVIDLLLGNPSLVRKQSPGLEDGSKMLLEILKGFSELRQRLLQIVRQHRGSDQVGCGPVVVGARRLGAEIAPAVEIAVAAAEPRQGDEVDLLVDVQTADEA